MRTYRRKRSARFKSPSFKWGPPAVEPSSFSFTNCESHFTDNFILTSSKEGGVIDFNDSIDSVAATDSNSDNNAASIINSISSSEKFELTTLVLSITASTSVFTLHKLSARKPFKCSIQNSHRMVLKEIPIPLWPIHYSNAYDLFQLSSFNENDCKFPEPSYFWLGENIRSQDSSVTLTDYF